MHELRPVWSLSRVHGHLRISADCRVILASEQRLGVPQVGDDYDRHVDLSQLSEILSRDKNGVLLLRTLGFGNLPSGALCVPEVDIDSQTDQTDLRTLQLTSVHR